jgi:hypothetical protein
MDAGVKTCSLFSCFPLSESSLVLVYLLIGPLARRKSMRASWLGSVSYSVLARLVTNGGILDLQSNCNTGPFPISLHVHLLHSY